MRFQRAFTQPTVITRSSYKSKSVEQVTRAQDPLIIEFQQNPLKHQKTANIRARTLDMLIRIIILEARSAYSEPTRIKCVSKKLNLTYAQLTNQTTLKPIKINTLPLRGTRYLRDKIAYQSNAIHILSEKKHCCQSCN